MQHGSTDLGALLKSLREKRDVSQSKLAERAGFDHSYISRLEGGRRMPTRDAVHRLGEAMDLLQPQLDSLLAAAGYLPRDVSSLLSSEPAIGEILDLLQDKTVPMEFRDNLRQILRLLADQGRFAIRESSTQDSGTHQA